VEQVHERSIRQQPLMDGQYPHYRSALVRRDCTDVEKASTSAGKRSYVLPNCRIRGLCVHANLHHWLVDQ
jgi:hypothetical protein